MSWKFHKSKRERTHRYTHKKNEISLEWLVGPLCIVLIRIRIHIHINVSYLLCSYLSKWNDMEQQKCHNKKTDKTRKYYLEQLDSWHIYSALWLFFILTHGWKDKPTHAIKYALKTTWLPTKVWALHFEKSTHSTAQYNTAHNTFKNTMLANVPNISMGVYVKKLFVVFKFYLFGQGSNWHFHKHWLKIWIGFSWFFISFFFFFFVLFRRKLAETFVYVYFANFFSCFFFITALSTKINIISKWMWIVWIVCIVGLSISTSTAR